MDLAAVLGVGLSGDLEDGVEIGFLCGPLCALVGEFALDGLELLLVLLALAAVEEGCEDEEGDEDDDGDCYAGLGAA